ncbi:hypothetical protein Tco_0580219, partial [Tanacetum coccineum]
MLDRTDFALWQQRIRLYYRGENGVNILKSIDEGPFQMGTFQETLAEGNEGALHLGPERPRAYSNLSPKDKERMQLNSKFVNNMFPEWGRFVTAVKLNRGLRDSNYDQLYAYLKQHEARANENKMLLDRFTQHTVDPLTLISNVTPQQYNSQSSTNPSSIYVPPHFAGNSQLDSGLSPTDNLIEKNQATIQDGRVMVQNVQGRQNRGQGNNARGASTAGYEGAQNIVGNANPGQARQVKCYKCNGGQYNAVDEDVDEQPVQDLALNVDNVFQADDCDAFDSDVDEAPTTQTMFMANLSSADPVYNEAGLSYDLNILSEALTKEIKEIKDIFEELEAAVDQNGVDRKHDEIERKNLLIANDNLIVDCLSKEVFYVAKNYKLNVSSFTEMHDAHASLKARCLELEVELSNLRDKIQKDDHDELIKLFSNLE